MPPVHVLQYTTQILSVIVALLDDPDESVQLTAVTCLLTVIYHDEFCSITPTPSFFQKKKIPHHHYVGFLHHYVTHCANVCFIGSCHVFH